MALDNLRTSETYRLLADTIRRVGAGKRLIYVTNSGNWGDGLIHSGALQFFESMNLAVDMRSKGAMTKVADAVRPINYCLSDCVLITSGSGAWGRNWSQARLFVAKMAPVMSHVIVLPTTYEFGPIENDDGKVTYFARDAGTSLETCPQALFCHDMAFFLDLDVTRSAEAGETGYFFRTDTERSPHQVILGDGYDISAIGSEIRPVLPMFKILRGYRRIVTDRLHVAIAASLLGIEAELYLGNYWKAREIYASSIAGRYPGTTLVDWPQESGAPD